MAISDPKSEFYNSIQAAMNHFNVPPNKRSQVRRVRVSLLRTLTDDQRTGQLADILQLAAKNGQSSKANSTAAKAGAPSETTWKVVYKEAGAIYKTGFHGGSRRVARLLSKKHQRPISHSTVISAGKRPNKSPRRRGHPNLLTDQQESLVVDLVRLLRSSKLMVPPATVRQWAYNTIHEETGYTNESGTLSQNWFTKFSRRHKLGSHDAVPLEVDRAAWFNSRNMKIMFDTLAEALIDNGLAVRNPTYRPDLHSAKYLPGAVSRAQPVQSQ